MDTVTTKKRKLSGDGPFCKEAQSWLQDHFQAPLVVLTPSCTAALEMGLLLMDLQPGDEVIVPSFTFSSTATAVVLYGGIPVFVDSSPDTLTLDPACLDAALTEKTKGLIPMHYAGVGCDMEKIQAFATKHNLFILEDAAQCMGARYQGKRLGTFGSMAAFSFHETKNISCGEGGCLVINDPALVARAEIMRDKGTNRSSFFKGQVDKYTWVEKGSSYLMSDLQAEYLLGQLQRLDKITHDRLQTWHFYHTALAPLEQKGKLMRMQVPLDADHNAHIYYLILPSEKTADQLKDFLNEEGVAAVSHYVPLHLSPAGQKYGRPGSESLPIATDYPSRLLRLPVVEGMSLNEKEKIHRLIEAFFQKD